VLRNLFAPLLDEEIRRDEIRRSAFRAQRAPGLQRSNAPLSITLPELNMVTTMSTPNTASTPRAANGTFKYPATPGMAIGLATPGGPLSFGSATTPGPMSPSVLSPTTEEGDPLEQVISRQSGQADRPEQSNDYFSASANVPHSEASSENTKQPATPGGTVAPGSVPTSPTEEKKKSGLFGKKFQMAFPKKLARVSTEVVKPTAPAEEKGDAESTKSSEKEEKIIDDNFYGVIQKIHQEYEDHMDHNSDQPLPLGITPSLPIETPVIKPPPHTLIIIQEDDPASGGVADQYRGEINELGKDVDTLEKIAPMWLGELLLRVRCSLLLQHAILTIPRTKSHLKRP